MLVKTSIIVPVYNTAQFLRECFESIFRQSQKEIEVIAVNDGSTDESLEILEEIKKEHPELIIFSQKNKGLGAARNKGVELASGEYIYFIDSDDCLEINAMETCYCYAKKYKADIVMFDAYTFGDVKHEESAYDRQKIIKEQKSVMSGMEYIQKYWSKAFCPTACLIYTSVDFWEKCNLKFLTGIYYEDVEFHCKAIPLADSIIYIPQKLYRRRYREGSITISRFDYKHAEDNLHIIRAVAEHECNDKIKKEKQNILYSHLSSLLKKCEENELLGNKEFAKEIYEAAQEIYGYNIDEIKEHRNINVLSRLSNILSDEISVETCEKIKSRKSEIWKEICKEIPLASKNKFIGVYGIGKKTEEFLCGYEENIGEIIAEVVYIESNIKSKEKKFRGRDVFNVNDIGDTSFCCIVIASSKYEEEMYQTLMEKYYNKFKIIRLNSDLHF